MNGRCWPDHDRRIWRSQSSGVRLHLSLLGDLQRVIDLDPEVPDRALKFAVAEEELDGPEIPGPPVDQCRLGAPH